jgi:hypothetical protein
MPVSSDAEDAFDEFEEGGGVPLGPPGAPVDEGLGEEAEETVSCQAHELFVQQGKEQAEKVDEVRL